MEFVNLDSITTDLLNVVRGSTISQSEPISKRQLEAWVHQYRALLLKRDLDKGKMPNPDYIQEIDHVRLSPVDTAGDNVTSSGVTTGNNVLRSDLTLPNAIDLNFKSGLTYIGTVDGNEIQLVPETRSKWQQYKKYTSSEPLAFLRNNYLYVMYDNPMEFVSVRGVFEIPPEVGRFVNPMTNQPYFDTSTKYPIPANMIPTLKEMILQKELGIESQAFSDVTPDAAHGVSPQTSDVKYTQYNRR